MLVSMMLARINLARWRQPEVLLYLMAAAVPLSFASWQTLLNNFAIEQAAFTGAEMGILQGLREVHDGRTGVGDGGPKAPGTVAGAV